MTITLYRIVRSSMPTEADFRTARDLGKPLLSPKYEREWAEGLSCYDSLEYAIDRAIVSNYLLGDHVAIVQIPEDGSIEIAQTTRDVHHFSVYATPDRILPHVVRPAMRAVGSQRR